MNDDSGQHRSYEWVLLVALLLVAFWFRTYRLADVPLGLHHDDVKNVLLVERILGGYWRAYYPENYGHEPLYHWLQALYFGLLGSGYPELRLLSVGISILGLAAIYALVRRLLGRNVALWSLAWQAVSLWPLFYSRRAIRGILLPPLAALTGYWFFAGLDCGRKPFGRRWVAWALGGAGLAACLYTYAGSRVLPLFFLLYVVYLALAHRDLLRARWRGLVLFGAVATLLVAPLAVYLVANPEERMGQINAPLAALGAGDPRPLLENSLRVLGMFAFVGDPHWRQFVADTPVFGPLGAILFFAGILIALWRWRRYPYAYALLWLPVTLLPGMLSEGAPNFLRPIAALTLAYVYPALAANEGLAWLSRRRDRSAWAAAARIAAAASLVVVLGLHAWRTFDGYFVRWPQHPDARFAYSSSLLETIRYLDRTPQVERVLLSGHFPADLDPALAERFLRRDDLEPRWADVRQALVYPADPNALLSSAPAYVVQPDHFAIDAALRELFIGQEAPVYEQYGPEGGLSAGGPAFSVYHLHAEPLAERLAAAQAYPVGWSGATTFAGGLPDDWALLEERVSFADRVDLLGYEILNDDPAAPGDVVSLLTYWRATQPGPASAITFVHLLGPDGTVVSGYDGFGAPPNRWQANDVVVQVHRFALPGDLAPGVYPIELGWYEPDSGVRWPVALPGGGQIDRLLLEPLRVATNDE